MKFRFRNTFLLAALSPLLLLAPSACSSQKTPETNVATTTSPTPDPAAQTSPTPNSEIPPASGNPSAGTSASSSGNTAVPGGTSSNPSLASSRPPASGSNLPSSAPNNPPPPPPRVYTIESGTPLSVWTTSTISTKTAKAGDRFTATLAKPIVDGDWVVAKKGATVEGTVIDSDSGGKVKGLASLSLKLDRLTLADGRTVEVDTSRLTREAKSTKKKDAVKVGVGAGIGAAIGAIAGGGKGAAIGAGAGGAAGGGYVLATRGDPAVIGSETQLNFRLTSPVKVTRR
jgi:hypothetical protein